jgi:cob(I)alamin adenosyltransferase
LNLAKKAMVSGEYQMIILDEINVALDFKLIPIEEVVEMIQTKPPSLDLVLTGRYAPAEIIALADTVSEIKEIKHHYTQGIKEKAGIEF